MVLSALNNINGDTMENTFEQRLAEARTKALRSNGDTRLKSDIAINDSLKRESIKTLTTIINSLVEELGLDAERFAKRIDATRRSKYGRICEMISIIASIYAWPMADSTQASEIVELRERVLDTLETNSVGVDADLLLDIKEAKGFNSFMDMATFELKEGVEPIYDELEYFYYTFAEYASLPIIDFKMNESVWQKEEAKALERVRIEQEAAKEALERFNAMTGEVA